MTKFQVMPMKNIDTQLGATMERFSRRVAALPVGSCPVAAQVALLETACQQTCGKCVPCRDGLPQLARLLREIESCTAS